MSHRTASIFIAALLAAFTGLVSVGAFRLVQEEDRAGILELAQLSLGENRFTLFDSSTPDHNFGEIVVQLSDADEQFTIVTSGWLNLKLGATTWVQELSATAVFNPLGQLSAAIFKTSLNAGELRLGLSNVNPIRVQIITSPPTKTLLEQSMPGPIELSKRGDKFVLTSRALGHILPNATPEQISRIPAPFRVRESSPGSLASDRATSKPLDLTPLARGIEAFQSQLGSFLLPPRP